MKVIEYMKLVLEFVFKTGTIAGGIWLLVLAGCSQDEEWHKECTTVKTVLLCLEEDCRVEFENGDRASVYVTAVGDKYCRNIKYNKDKIVIKKHRYYIKD